MTRTKNNNLNVTYDCHYHVVWCSKYRRKVITSQDTSLNNLPLEKDGHRAVDERFKEIAYDVAQEHNFTIEKMEIMPDHVHLLIECDPQFGIARAVKMIKGRTSKVLRSEFPSLKSRIPTLWTNSYFVATTGGASLEVVKKYIENQRKV